MNTFGDLTKFDAMTRGLQTSLPSLEIYSLRTPGVVKGANAALSPKVSPVSPLLGCCSTAGIATSHCCWGTLLPIAPHHYLGWGGEFCSLLLGMLPLTMAGEELLLTTAGEGGHCPFSGCRGNPAHLDGNSVLSGSAKYRLVPITTLKISAL